MGKNEILPSGPQAATTTQLPKERSYRILVVDDDSKARRLKVDLLIKAGYDVEAVNDGAYGWAALQVKHYDLVITDNTMPRMTGVEMIERVRALHMPVLVIMATGFMLIFEFNSKPWLQPDGGLTTPFSDESLLWLVKNTLNKEK